VGFQLIKKKAIQGRKIPRSQTGASYEAGRKWERKRRRQCVRGKRGVKEQRDGEKVRRKTRERYSREKDPSPILHLASETSARGDLLWLNIKGEVAYIHLLN